MPQALSLYSQLGNSDVSGCETGCSSSSVLAKSWIRLVLLERRRANHAALFRLVPLQGIVAVALAAGKLAAMILEVALGDRHAPLAVSLGDRASRIERSIRGTDRVGIEARARTHASRRRASIAQIHRRRVIRMPGSNQTSAPSPCGHSPSAQQCRLLPRPAWSASRRKPAPRYPTTGW